MIDVVLGATRISANDETPKSGYYFIDSGLPGIDFNREIIRPGTNEHAPNGALVIRCDDDFWIAAVLSLEYESWPLEQIVTALWPDYAADAQYTPDSDTPERELYNLNQYAESEHRRADFLQKDYDRITDENARLRAQRPAPHERYSSRAYASNNYFIRQYESLLVAVAHKFEPRPEGNYKGLCIHCGLYSNDRVHHKDWIERRAIRSRQSPSDWSKFPKSLYEFPE